MDNTNKSKIKYNIINNIIYISRTKYMKNKCVIYVETMSIEKFRRNTYEKTYLEKTIKITKYKNNNKK